MDNPVPLSLKPWGKLILASLAGFCGLISAWWYSAPYLLLRLLPEPSYETFVIEGSDASNQLIDLEGQWFNGGRPTEILVRSVAQESGWSRPQNITIRNGKLRGSIRIMGLGRNGEDEAVRASSISEGHTARARAAAPTLITIENLSIEADYRIPIYVAPGATGITVRDCTFSGRSVSTVIYLCAESARNTIEDNSFETKVGREVIAVDGSADNRISGNNFQYSPFGGVYLYRNCGEGGTVRHQTPHNNLIENNTFADRPRWGSSIIWWAHAEDGLRIAGRIQGMISGAARTTGTSPTAIRCGATSFPRGANGPSETTARETASSFRICR